MINLPNLRQIEILSLSRNVIKKISGLEEIGQTLKELWLSYNFIEKLDGLQPCIKLHTLYIGNNRIRNWDEIDKLKDLPDISNVLFVGTITFIILGNTIYENQKEDPKMLVLKRVPTLKNVDGVVIDESVLEKLKTMAELAPTTTAK
jgi:dynein light chain 1